MINIGFFGTPFLAKKVLEDLYNSNKINISFVVTNPDKPVGRKQLLEASPVKEFAITKNIPFFQPDKIKNNKEFLDSIKKIEVDYFIVMAYGKILPLEILNIPKKLNINIHVSILPKYRGASPIQSALINGDVNTGIAIMKMTEGMDEGEILDILEIPIDKYDNCETLTNKISKFSGGLLLNTLDKSERGALIPVPQNNNEATYCTKIIKEDGFLDFFQSAQKNFYLWKGLTPWPGICTFFENKKLIIEKCDFIEKDYLVAKIGEVIWFENNIGIKCSKGILILKQVKLEGKKSQEIRDFINGHKDFIGYIFTKSQIF